MEAKIIVANWKLNPGTWREARELAAPIARAAKKLTRVRAIICPPAVYLNGLKGVELGAQDCFWEKSGAHTGRLAPAMLRSVGVTTVIVGHSEMRAAGDDDAAVNRKVRAALAEGLAVILCVGERARDPEGHYLRELETQLINSLAGVSKKQASQLIIAYEPLWAIGALALESDSPEGFRHQAIFIRKVLAGQFSKELALRLPILYGGSVNTKNAAGFLTSGAASGLLVGRESLRADKFIEILKIANY